MAVTEVQVPRKILRGDLLSDDLLGRPYPVDMILDIHFADALDREWETLITKENQDANDDK